MSSTTAASAEEALSSAEPAAIEVEGWVHRLGGWAERHPRFVRWVADRETSILADRLDGVAIHKPVYITGLARSGSTILLELLARHPALASHRYRDFPLVLTPWAWNWFIDRASTRNPCPRERAHRDGIDVTPESPEGYEEVVWMAFFDGLHDPRVSGVLDAVADAPGFERFYRAHIRKLVLLRNAERYLAKNNYDVTRLAYLLKLFPDARFVIPIRDPVWHIASLMKQHRLFCREEERDPRVLQHMTRSGHFEFGLNRRAINPGDDEAARAVDALWRDGREVEGWARYWSMIYGHLADAMRRDESIRTAARIVRYEDLCARPAETMRQVLDHCELSYQELPDLAAATVQPPEYYRPSFTSEEEQIIRETTQSTAARFGYDTSKAAEARRRGSSPRPRAMAPRAGSDGCSCSVSCRDCRGRSRPARC